MATETSRETNPLSSEKPPSSPLMPFADSRRLFGVRPFSIIGETSELEVASTPSEEGEPLGWGPLLAEPLPPSWWWRERQHEQAPPGACSGSSGLGTAPTMPGTPRWGTHCSNLVSFLSLPLYPFALSDLHDQIIKTIKGLPWQGEDPRRLLQSLSRLQKPRTFIL